ncbi:MAG: hypothetical protein LBC85_06235 [Fibromonadaceae bacterium]|jgi:hypothetical protein|nr:hypothetical protein [Fibromonadaceae bacterium]
MFKQFIRYSVLLALPMFMLNCSGGGGGGTGSEDKDACAKDNAGKKLSYIMDYCNISDNEVQRALGDVNLGNCSAEDILNMKDKTPMQIGKDCETKVPSSSSNTISGSSSSGNGGISSSGGQGTSSSSGQDNSSSSNGSSSSTGGSSSSTGGGSSSSTTTTQLYCGYNSFKVCIPTDKDLAVGLEDADKCDYLYGEAPFIVSDGTSCVGLNYTLHTNIDEVEIVCAITGHGCLPISKSEPGFENITTTTGCHQTDAPGFKGNSITYEQCIARGLQYRLGWPASITR